MATSRGTIGLLVAMMLLTGCSNSLWSKYQDLQCVENCNDPEPSRRKDFQQPVWQTLNMFVGEALCLLVLMLLQSRLNPWRPRPTLPDDDDDASEDAEDSAIGMPPPLSKAKYRAISQSNPDDSGIALDDDRFVTHPARRGVAGAVAASRLVREDEGAPFGAHGATPTPVTAVLDEDEFEVEGEELKGAKALYFLLPALFDIAGTTLMNVGLLFTPVSVFQMVRGALPLWVGLFSVIFLGRRLGPSKWMSLIIIMLGVALVGLAGALDGRGNGEDAIEAQDAAEGAGTVVLGVSLIFGAQFFTASQFVVEEKIMTKYSVPPLRAVGLEGVFGLVTTLIIMPILHLLVGKTPQGRGGFFDMRAGWSQITAHAAIAWSCLAIAFSIALFNFAGLAVTRSVSATARSVVDTSRSIGIWCFSLLVGWERFRGLQLAGFVLLVLGSFLFNDVLPYPAPVRRCFGEDDEDEGSDCGDRTVEVEEASHEARAVGGSSREHPSLARFRRTSSRDGTLRRSSDEDTPLLRD